MNGWQRIGVVISVAWLVGLPTVQALAQDQNAQTLIQAARSLKFTEPGNKAFILEKQETVVSEVAVIFGYGDNRSACQQIAEILIASQRAGTFKCHPIY
jgi:hypothetical protein